MSNDLLRYCQLAQRMGFSRNKALALYRKNGYQIRTADFGKMWNTAKASRQLAGGEGIARVDE